MIGQVNGSFSSDICFFFLDYFMLMVFPISPSPDLQLNCRTHQFTKCVVISRLSSEMNIVLEIGKINSAGRSLCWLFRSMQINELRNQLNRFYEIIDGTYQRLSNPQIGRDAAIQYENWHTGEAGFEHRIDNLKPLSTKAAHLVGPIDRRAPMTGWHQSSTSNMFPVSQDSRNYARMSSPINSGEYFSPDVPSRFVSPSQERISDSRFLPANFAYHAQRGHTLNYYSSSERLGSWHSVKPPYNDAMMYHYPSTPRTHQNSSRNPDYSFRGAARSAYRRIERKPLPFSTGYKFCPVSENIGSLGNGRDNNYGVGDGANYPLSSGRYYRNTYERTSPRTLRRSANQENLRGLPVRTV